MIKDMRCKHGMIEGQCAYCKGYAVSEFGTGSSKFYRVNKAPVDYLMKQSSENRLAKIATHVKKRM